MPLIAEPVIANAILSGKLVVFQELRSGRTPQKAKAITRVNTGIKQ